MRYLFLLIITVVSLSVSAQSKTEKLLHRIVASEMTRYRHACEIDTKKGPKWNYTQGLELKAMLDFADVQGDEGFRSMVYKYVEGYTDTLINENGVIYKYDMSAFKLDDVNSGKLLFRMLDFTGKKKYRYAMDSLRHHLERQPRTEDGGFWHKKIYPEQMWLDGLYMSAPYYAEYAQWFEAGEKRAMSMDDVEHQFCLMYNRAYCDKCKLLHHAWDADSVQGWADKNTGRSAHAWGRAEGWYLMALVDYLEIYQNNSSKYYAQDQGVADSLAYILQSLCGRMLELRDETTGAWHQVLDCSDREGNYLEMSVTPMMAYVYLKGVRLGYLDEQYRKEAIKTLRGIERHFVTEDESGLVVLKSVCKVAGLSDTRNGSYEYYINEQKQDNDPKGLGPWIMALTEEMKIKN